MHEVIEAVVMGAFLVCAAFVWGIFVNGIRTTLFRIPVFPVQTLRFWIYGLVWYLGWTFLNLLWTGGHIALWSRSWVG